MDNKQVKHDDGEFVAQLVKNIREIEKLALHDNNALIDSVSLDVEEDAFTNINDKFETEKNITLKVTLKKAPPIVETHNINDDYEEYAGLFNSKGNVNDK